MTKEILLSKNGKYAGMYVAIVDDEDYEILGNKNWYAEPKGINVYVYRKLNQVEKSGRKTRRISLHRFIMNAPDGMEVDHINGNGLDNRRENLRICTRSENAKNIRKHKGVHSSIYKGVRWYSITKRWHAQISDVTKDGKRTVKSIGYFDDETEAAKAYDIWAHRLHGEFASPNFRPPNT